VLFFSTMILLDDLLIEEKVFTTHFACDVSRCKGACCTLPGGSGAPVLDEEVEALKKAQENAKKYLSDRSRIALEEMGPLEGHQGEWATTCIDDSDCVFVAYENGVAICSLEKAYHNGESEFRKPLSCHLFPIRIADFGGPFIHYEQFAECAPGRKRGEKEQILLIESVRDALIRAFGEEMFNKIADKAGISRRESAT